MLDVFEVGEKMRTCMTEIRRLCSQLDKAGAEKANAEVEYDTKFDIALEVLAADDVPVTIRKAKAKGILAKSGVALRFKLAEATYRTLDKKIDAAEKVLGAWQSYNRHLDVGVHQGVGK